MAKQELTDLSKEMKKIINEYRTKLSKATGKKISYPTASRVVAKTYRRYEKHQEPTVHINMVKRKRRRCLYDDSGLKI